jgi:chaperonin GroES
MRQKPQSKYSTLEDLFMKLKPMADNILLKTADTESTTSSGIILATTTKEKPGIYEVVSAGPGTKDVTVTVKPGDKVVVANFVGNDIKLDGVDYKFVKQDEILAVVTD